MPVIRCKSVCKYQDEGCCCTQKEVCFGKNGECWTRGYQPWYYVNVRKKASRSFLTKVICGAKCDNRDALGYCTREDVSFGKYGLCHERGDMYWNDSLREPVSCNVAFLTKFQHILRPGDSLCKEALNLLIPRKKLRSRRGNMPVIRCHQKTDGY